jgi:hypothetical protein
VLLVKLGSLPGWFQGAGVFAVPPVCSQVGVLEKPVMVAPAAGHWRGMGAELVPNPSQSERTLLSFVSAYSPRNSFGG